MSIVPPPAQRLPRLRTQNPPNEVISAHENLVAAYERQFSFFVLAIAVFALFCVPPITMLFRGAAFAFIVWGAIAAGAYALLVETTRKALPVKPAEQPEPLPTYSFNNEYLVPLADGSLLRMTVYFQIPSQNAPLTSSHVHPYTPSVSPDSPMVRELSSVTENIILHYCAYQRQPPLKESIEDHLQTYLVQFQNDNRILFLRVNVPLIIRKEPEKPKVTVRV